MKPVDDLMRNAVAEGIFPGGVLHVSKKAKNHFHQAYGVADTISKRPVTPKTVFDLASLTKPLATTLSIMKLVEQKKLELDQSLSMLLTGFAGNEKGEITVRHLLSHTSGLTDYRPYYEKLREIPQSERKTTIREFLKGEMLLHPVGGKTLYSDIGFMILCWIVEEISKRRLNDFASDEIYTPAGLKDLFFIDLESPAKKGYLFNKEFAATEKCPWRRKVLIGEVHDDNAFVVGGIDGHAGLFGTAAEVGRLLQLLQSLYHGYSTKSVLLSETVRQFLSRQGDMGRALGFDIPDPGKSSCGHYFSENTVGHLGFTGTSFWMDLEKEINVILLTNRVHPSRDNDRIRAFRPLIHDAIMKNI
jgi:CubicO group peptidase (beta-lactamase class C family)